MNFLLWHLKHQIIHDIDFEANCQICHYKYIYHKKLILIRLMDNLIKWIIKK